MESTSLLRGGGQKETPLGLQLGYKEVGIQQFRKQGELTRKQQGFMGKGERWG